MPLFKKQIADGGPISNPQRNYKVFHDHKGSCSTCLTIPTISKGEILLLEMGEAIKIEELAKQMITLSGLKLKDEHNPDGDIEIKTTGLRPGEKLFEELLVDNNSEPTIHPLICKAKEAEIDQELFQKDLEILEEGIKRTILN